MIKLEKIQTWGFEHAIRGMRNPKNSHDRSDSGWKYWCNDLDYGEEPHYCNHCGYDTCHPKENPPEYVIGENDMTLMQRLYKAGTEHRKYLRQIFVSMDITAPHYFWHDFDAYKIGVTKDSCSKIHRIQEKEFTLDDFSCEYLEYDYLDADDGTTEKQEWAMSGLITTITRLNRARDLYIKTGKKEYWWIMIQLLPLSYNQKATVTMNYENVVNIIHQRENHKLDEFREFCEALRKLPYVKEIMETREDQEHGGNDNTVEP